MATVSGANGQSAGIGKRCFTVVRRLRVQMVVLVDVSLWTGGWCDCGCSWRSSGLPSSSRMPVTGRPYTQSGGEAGCRCRRGPGAIETWV